MTLFSLLFMFLVLYLSSQYFLFHDKSDIEREFNSKTKRYSVILFLIKIIIKKNIKEIRRVLPHKRIFFIVLLICLI